MSSHAEPHQNLSRAQGVRRRLAAAPEFSPLTSRAGVAERPKEDSQGIQPLDPVRVFRASRRDA